MSGFLVGSMVSSRSTLEPSSMVSKSRVGGSSSKLASLIGCMLFGKMCLVRLSAGIGEGGGRKVEGSIPKEIRF